MTPVEFNRAAIAANDEARRSAGLALLPLALAVWIVIVLVLV